MERARAEARQSRSCAIPSATSLTRIHTPITKDQKDMNRIATRLGLAAISAAILAAPALAQSDDCAAPTPIAGAVVVPFDLTTATPSGQGNVLQCVQGGGASGFLGRDVWFCWTADCDGMVRISTCGLTQGDTVVAIYPEAVGCNCPGDMAPLCCSDDACEKQSEVTCEVRCGVRYLIQVGTKPNSPGFTGSVRIECEGKPCEGGGNGGALTPPECGECCGARPPLVDGLSTPFAPGQVAVATQFRDFGSGPALFLVDIGDQTAAPVGGPPISNWNTQRYTHPTWDIPTLGAVFGNTFDGAGNIFVAHTTVYPNWFVNFDLVGFGGAGAIYRINGATGAIDGTPFKVLPQQVDPSLSPTAPYPGVGQLDFDCTRNLLIASNFEDGRIYTIHASTGVVHAFDFATGSAAGPMNGNGNQLAEAGDAPGAAPLGERAWAVKLAGDRIYYSVWSQDSGASVGAGPNTVRSVRIDAAGAFLPSSDRLELATQPYAPGYPTNPISDISFDNECCMLVSERSMFGLSDSSAHASRTMRFCFDAAAAAWSTPITYDVGHDWGPHNYGTNSAGGVDFVLGSNGPQVWSLADAVQISASPFIYGLTAQPVAGGGESNGPAVDLDGDTTQFMKYQLGSLDITCWDAAQSLPCEFDTGSIRCVPNSDGTMGYIWNVTVTNNSAVPANLLILPDPFFAPNNVIVLNPALGQGASTTLQIPISGGAPGTQFCFSATLAGSTGHECCTQEVCIQLPDCECFDSIVNVKDVVGANNFEFSLNMTNLTPLSGTPFVGEWVTLAVAPGYAATISPTLINIPSLPVFASTPVGPISVSTALPPGSVITIIVGLHSQSFHPCCFREIEITVPAPTASSTPGDANGDGVVNASDLAMVLSGWGTAGATDLNRDGTTDAQDLAILLANWS